MNKIQSFTIDHTVLLPGFYVSRTDDDITTFDMRICKPNTEELLSNSEMHSFEHMFATLIRNSKIADDVIYFGPMGCQTGFYLLIRNAVYIDVLSVIQNCLEEIIVYSGEVFGNSDVECGNYATLSLEAAKKIAKTYSNILEDVLANKRFSYNQ